MPGKNTHACTSMERSTSSAVTMARTKVWPDARPTISSMKNGNLSKVLIPPDAPSLPSSATPKSTSLVVTMAKSALALFKSSLPKTTNGQF